MRSADPQICATATWRPGLCAPELRFITLREVSTFHDSKGWMGRMEAGCPVISEFASAVWRAMDTAVCNGAWLQRDVSLVHPTCARCDQVLTFEAVANPDPEVSSSGRRHSVLLFSTTHCSLKVYCAILVRRFQLSPPGVSTRVTTRDHPTAEGGTVGDKCLVILPKCRFTRCI